MYRFGILTTALPARHSKRAHDTKYVPSRTWRLFHSAGYQKNLQVLFFRAEDVDFSNKRVHAWSCSTKDGLSGWTRAYHPLPDVVYENCFLHLIGSDRRILQVKRALIQRGIPTFNPGLFNKTAMHTILSGHQSTKQYVPPSKAVTKVADIMQYLQLYKIVYLKPVNGSGGAGILQIELLSDQRIRVQSERFIHDRKFVQEFTAKTFQIFMRRLLRKRTYLVQKGLKLLHRDKQKIDFRVVVHRDENGVWRSAGIRPKLAKSGAIVTNSHAGGKKTTWTELVSWAQKENKRLPERTAIEQPAIAVGKLLTQYRKTLSHIGIDVAVCEDGEIYVLDVNPRPGRDLLTKDMLVRVTEYTAGFAKYLAERKHKKRSER